MSAAYAGRQFVGVDLHRRRSVIVRMAESGERLETVRILNDPERLAAVMTPGRGCTGGGAGEVARATQSGGAVPVRIRGRLVTILWRLADSAPV